MEISKELEEAILVNVMMASCIAEIDGKTAKVSKLEKTIKDSLYEMFKTKEEIHYINRFGFPAMKYKVSQQYIDLESRTGRAWEKTRKEHIPKDSKWMVSMSELLTQLHNSLNRNKYQHRFVSEKIVIAAINSFASHIGGRATIDEDYNHARDLAFGFRDNVGIKKNPLLTRLAINAKNDLILEGKI